MPEQMTWIAPVYLHLLVERAAANPDPPEDVQLTNEALQYARKALDGEVPPPFEPTPKIPALPPGEYARVEIMGHDQVTGWVTEGIRAGVPVMIVRDWDGVVVREIPGHALYQFVPLPTPLRRPGPRPQLPPDATAALPAAEAYEGYYGDGSADLGDADVFTARDEPPSPF